MKVFTDHRWINVWHSLESSYIKLVIILKHEKCQMSIAYKLIKHILVVVVTFLSHFLYLSKELTLIWEWMTRLV